MPSKIRILTKTEAVYTCVVGCSEVDCSIAAGSVGYYSSQRTKTHKSCFTQNSQCNSM